MFFKLILSLSGALLLSLSLSAQTVLVNDDFESGTLTGWTECTAGHWRGNGTPAINGSFSLKHNLSGIASNSCITRQLATNPAAGTLTWQWNWQNGNWDPSGNNRFLFYLMSDQSDVSGTTHSGYAVGLNLGSTDDRIALYRVDNGGLGLELIKASSSYNVNSNTLYGIRVTRTPAGTFELFIDDDGDFNNLVSIGTATDLTYQTNLPWCGLYFLYTSSRAGLFYMDDVLVTTNAGSTPQISLEVSRDTLREGAEFDLILRSSPAPNNTLSFPLQVSGTALQGWDYPQAPMVVAMIAGDTEARYTFRTVNDNREEGTENIRFMLDGAGLSGFTMADSVAEVAITEGVMAMTYNLLRYTSSSGASTKNADLAPILDYLQPDILGVNELDRASGGLKADSLLNGALNVNGITWYDRARHDNPSFSPVSNMLYFNTHKFGLASQSRIDISGFRPVNVYRLYRKYPGFQAMGDSLILTVLQAHLKAGEQTQDSLDRLTVANAVMSWVNAQGAGNYLLMGDLNLYTDQEAAYQQITQFSNPNVRFFDPINRPGDWSENSAFADIHTQSTRDNSSMGGGSTGGMDDRFDFILVSPGVMNGSDSIQVLPGTYQAVGQDGIRFNQAINSPFNTLVPASIADALWRASDHLPVTVMLDFGFQCQPAISAAFSATQNSALQFTFMNQSSGDSLYYWDFGDGSASFTENPVHNFGANGTYQVCLYVEGDCGWDSTCQFVNAGPLGINGTQEVGPRVAIYPNPAGESVTVRVAGEQAMIRIMDVQGSVLQQVEIMGEQKISLAGMAAGMYWLDISGSGWRAVRKLSKR